MDESKPYTSGMLMVAAVSGGQLDPLRTLATYADETNWTCVVAYGRNWWCWVGPTIVGYELAGYGLGRSARLPREKIVERIPGLRDAHGQPVNDGDRVRFRYLHHFNDGDPETGAPESDPEERESEGVIRHSPYAGAYIVCEGRTYPVRRHRWFEAIS